MRNAAAYDVPPPGVAAPGDDPGAPPTGATAVRGGVDNHSTQRLLTMRLMETREGLKIVRRRMASYTR